MSRGLTFRSLMLFVCMLFAAGAVHSAAGALAIPAAKTDEIEWRPVWGEVGLVLTVSGPAGFYWRQEVGPGGAPNFSVFDENGGLRPAGSYVYELRAVPQIDDATRAELDAAREAGAGTVAKAGKMIESQSGSFAIRGGAIVMGGEEELQPGRPAGSGPRLSTKDFVIADDLIVNGGSSSICVGFDCVNGEVFGFDTLKLKENNTRIKFEDTSTGTFPSTDWQFTANDSASGGANKFSIEDITSARVPFTVTAGASTNSIFVDSTGRVGFRTSTPVLDLHVSTSNTPAMRLEQTSAGGFTAQTWDVAGNEANFFIRDVTGGSRLPFRIRPGAPTSSLDISADGDIGIGTASPEVELHIVATGEAATDVQFKIEANTDPAFDFEEQDSGITWRFINNNTVLKVVDVGTGADAAEEFALTQAGNLTITGQLITGGPQCGAATPCDRVFASDYEVESIEEHAALMWAKSYLPAVGPTEPGAPMNLSEKTGRILNELEKAHIYIEQLHNTVKRLEERLGEKEDHVLTLAEELGAVQAELEELRVKGEPR